MATATALDDTEEKSNGTKLARLLIDGGTGTFRRTFDSIYSPVNLQAALHTHKPLLAGLLRKRIIKQDQWNGLYPPRGVAPDSKTFDITLLFVLLRNICGLKKPATGWDALPPAGDLSQEANLARIKYYRNKVYGHIMGTEVSKVDFELYWNDISGALIALGADQVSIDLLKSSAIGEIDYLTLLNKWETKEVELKEMVCVLTGKVDQVLRQTPLSETLSGCEFSAHASSLVDQFQEGTRLLPLAKIEEFRTNTDKTSRALVITALPGVGKSALAAVACKNAREKGRLGACHFIQHKNTQRNNPRIVVESIARHLCDNVEGFKEKLDSRLLPLQQYLRNKLDEMDLETLTTVLLEEPLSKVQHFLEENAFVVIIDALDECDPRMRDEFVQVLLRKISSIPKWIKFVLTTRTAKPLADHPHVTVVNIDVMDSENTEDIRKYLSSQQQSMYPHESSALREGIISKLTDRSRGIFLYARFVVESAKKRTLSLVETSEIFPKGISSVYEEYLLRSKTDLRLDEKRFTNFLEAIAAAQSSLPESLVLQILGVTNESRSDRKKACQTLESLALLFPVEERHISVFHKSLAVWLSEAEYEDGNHNFSVGLQDGHRVLAEHCVDVLRSVKIHKRFPPKLNDAEKYALTFGFHHMLKADGFKEQLGECVQDLELLTAMFVARLEKLSAKMYEYLMAINSFYVELARIGGCCSLPSQDFEHLYAKIQSMGHIAYHPQFILQCAANCTASEGIKSKAIDLLRSSKYKHCVWIEEHNLCTLSAKHEFLSVSTNQHTIACIYQVFIEQKRHLSVMTLRVKNGHKLGDVDLGLQEIMLCTEISQDDKYIVVYEKLGIQLQIRAVQTLQVQRTFEIPANSKLHSCCFVQGNRLVAGSLDGSVRVWDSKSGALVRTLQHPCGQPTYCVASPLGPLLTVSGGSVVLWRSLAPPEHVTLTSGVSSTLEPETNKPSSSFSPDGKLVACVGLSNEGASQDIKVFNVKRGKLLHSFPADSDTEIVTFVDSNHLLVRNYDQMKLRFVRCDNGLSQEVPLPYRCIHRTGLAECVAIFRADGALCKLTFHNVN